MCSSVEPPAACAVKLIGVQLDLRASSLAPQAEESSLSP
jgi:hypothetical protein